MASEKEEITKMIEKLRILNAVPDEDIASWDSGYPKYHPTVRAFFVQMDTFWVDYDYVKNMEGLTLDRMASYDLQQLRTILTKIMRVERFSDGSWEHALQSGALIMIQERLVELAETK